MRKASSLSQQREFDAPEAQRPPSAGPPLTVLDVLYALAAIVLLPWWLLMLVFRPSFRAGFLSRFGFGSGDVTSTGSIWLHGSSAGELDLLRPLVTALERESPELDIVISAFAISGYMAAKKAYPDHLVIYFPVDLSPIIRRFVRRLNPCIVILVESEFWPNFIATVSRNGTPVCVVNGKMSEKSFRFHKRTFLVPWALRKVSLFAVQTDDHARRLTALGVAPQRVHVVGNMKYDLADVSDAGDLRETLREKYGIAAGKLVFMGGSVHAGEYEALASAHARLIEEGHDLRLILVPRYVAEAPKVIAALGKRGLEGVLKTEIGVGDSAVLNRPECVLVVDTMGELKSFYALSDVAYVGGSLTYRGSNKGGHNLMEPAILGVAPMFGPFNYSFRETVRDLTAGEAGLLVHNQQEICENLRRFLGDPGLAAVLGDRARQVILDSRGATEQVVTMLSCLIPAGPKEADASSPERWHAATDSNLRRERQKS